MYLINRASNEIAARIATLLNLDSDRQEVIAYGALSLLQSVVSVLLLIMFGLITKSLIEMLIIALGAAILRQFSGGAHATSPNRCAVSSMILFGGLSLISKYLLLKINIVQIILSQLIIVVFSLLLLYFFAPADSPNKRITNKEIRHRLRKKSFVIIILYELLAVILWFVFYRLNINTVLGYILCLHLGVLWQSISITFIGRFFVRGIDKLLRKIHI